MKKLKTSVAVNSYIVNCKCIFQCKLNHFLLLHLPKISRTTSVFDYSKIESNPNWINDVTCCILDSNWMVPYEHVTSLIYLESIQTHCSRKCYKFNRQI